jgi:hypothetical protein
MRATRAALVLSVLLSALAIVSAAPSMIFPVTTQSKPTPPPIPASVIVPKTAAMLPCADYPWAQPTWVRVGGMTIPRVVHYAGASSAQPPAWIAIG